MNYRFQYPGFFFSTSPYLSDHVHALVHDSERYLEELEFVCEAGTLNVTSPAIKTRILAALHITSHHERVLWFMKKCTGAEVAKAVSLLDRTRRAKQLQKKIAKIEHNHPKVEFQLGAEEDSEIPSMKRPKKSRKRKIELYRKLHNAIKTEMESSRDSGGSSSDADNYDSAVKELIQSASVSGSLARKVKRWAKSLKYQDLQLIMLGLPKDPWRNLSDIVHFCPDDFSDPNFLLDIHKESPNGIGDETNVEDSFVDKVRKLEGLKTNDLTQEFFSIAAKYPHIYDCYSYIRTKPEIMAEEDIVVALAANIPLDTALWYFEELHRVSSSCETIVAERLLGQSQGKNDEILNSSKLTYGKLVERIFTFERMNLNFSDSLIPLAKSRLESLKERWSSENNARFAVFGDASSSMQLAIEASTIFATMVSVCFSAELSFFSGGLVKSPYGNPSTVEETFDICQKIRASGCTSLAAALWPYYSEKKVMDTFILVTDEEENTSCHGYRFAPLLAEYKKHVNEDVKLIIVRVGKGYVPFQKSLESNGINYRVVGIDSSRPDLAKFDGLLGQLYMMTARERHEEGAQELPGLLQDDDNNMETVAVEVESEASNNDDDFVVV